MASSVVVGVCFLLQIFSVSAQLLSFIGGGNQDDSNRKCYDQLGCLDLGSPWKTIDRLAPEPVDVTEIDTSFTLYSRYLRRPIEINQWPRITINSYVDFNLPITVITHGFYASAEVDWVPAMRAAYLEKRNVNLIVVDWSKGALPPNYLQAVSNTRVVALEITRVLQFFGARGTDLNATHCIGHSLGAHTCGYVAKQLKEEGLLIKEVTALDAAQPMFERADPSVRLGKGDARFVLAIHTDAVPLVPFFGLGIMREIGDVDFYFNERVVQPGCAVDSAEAAKANITDFMDMTQIPWKFVAEYSACSHGRACLYYIEAIKGPCVFWGQKLTNTQRFLTRVPVANKLILSMSNACSLENCSPVGLETSRYPYRGAALVRTDDDDPFCDPNEATKLWNNEEMAYLSPNNNMV